MWRFISQKDKYPDVATVADNIKIICGGLALQNEHWFVSVGDLRARDASNDDIYQSAIKDIQGEFEEYLEASLVHVSGDSSWRKPEAGMLLAAASELGIPVEYCMFVGDRDEDRQAAAAAGMDFTWASAFFDGEVHPF